MASFLKTTFDSIVNNINTTIAQHTGSSPRNTRANSQPSNQPRARAPSGRPQVGTPGGAGSRSSLPNHRCSRPHIPSTVRQNQNQTGHNSSRSRAQQPTTREQAHPYQTRNSSNSTRHTDQTNASHSYDHSGTTNMSSNIHSSTTNAATSGAEKNLDITDVRDPQDINQLSAKQLKIILTRNCIDYRGVFEKEVLREKVMQLWIDCNEKRTTSGATQKSGSQLASDDIDESQVCKICMEREINCVLLECGHMLTCVNCGRKLSECPICRQNVTRCVRTFKG